MATMIESPKFPELTFEEKAHIYKLNGFQIPSVTTIMTPLSSEYYGDIDEELLANAAKRGTAVHNAIENFVKFDIEDIAPEFEGYFKAFKTWFKENNVVPIGTEIKLYHKALMYAGTADMMAVVNGVNTLIDFKTTSQIAHKLCGVQLEAYDRALKSHNGDLKFGQKIILHLKKDGTYKVIPFMGSEMEWWRVFTALKTVWDYKIKFNKGV